MFAVPLADPCRRTGIVSSLAAVSGQQANSAAAARGKLQRPFFTATRVFFGAPLALDFRFDAGPGNDAPTVEELQRAESWTQYDRPFEHYGSIQECLRTLPEAMLPSDVVQTSNELESKVDYMTAEERSKVFRACRLAIQSHHEQRRRSGEPFVIHPIIVATILAELNMDPDTVCAGLLHDTVEDTPLTFEEIEGEFGSQVRRIVEGETKISKLPKMAGYDVEDKQAENLRQMLVAMTEDLRVIIVKLADRLHNMRTLQFMPPHKRKRISRETLEIFAPLAHRLGIDQIKSELEDLSFQYLHSEKYSQLKRHVASYCAQIDSVVDQAKRELEEALHEDAALRDSISVTVMGRTKELYSLWRKMQRTGNSLTEINDLVALRVVLKAPDAAPRTAETEMAERMACYRVLGLVHGLWQPLPGKFKDYVAMPKPNSYQSLHTAVVAHYRHWFVPLEVQIRTERMHLMAEHGMAAHWLFKEGLQLNRLVPRNYAWLNEIRQWQKEFSSSREFVDAVRRDLLGSRVFVFTPQGQIVNLPKGASCIDLAYHIHSEIGHAMIGCKVNGRSAPVTYKLQNADVVEVLTSAVAPGPRVDWMEHCRTRSARNKIRQFLLKRRRAQMVEEGAKVLRLYLELQGLAAPSEGEDGSAGSMLESELAALAGFSSTEELFVALAQSVDSTNILERIGRSLLQRASPGRFRPVGAPGGFSFPSSPIRPLQPRGPGPADARPGPAPDDESPSPPASAAPAAEEAVASPGPSPPPRPRPGHPVLRPGLSEIAPASPASRRPAALSPARAPSGDRWGSSMYVRGSNNLLRLAGCCRPIKGDEVVGYLAGKEQEREGEEGAAAAGPEGARRGPQVVTVHRDCCPLLARLKARDGAREDSFVAVSWADEAGQPAAPVLYPALVRVDAADRNGLLGDVAGAITALGISIQGSKTITKAGEATLQFRMRVASLDQLQLVLDVIACVPGVSGARRL
eukprot:tig00020961_g16680.t1